MGKAIFFILCVIQDWSNYFLGDFSLGSSNTQTIGGLRPKKTAFLTTKILIFRGLRRWDIHHKNGGTFFEGKKI